MGRLRGYILPYAVYYVVILGAEAGMIPYPDRNIGDVTVVLLRLFLLQGQTVSFVGLLWVMVVDVMADFVILMLC